MKEYQIRLVVMGIEYVYFVAAKTPSIAIQRALKFHCKCYPILDVDNMEIYLTAETRTSASTTSTGRLYKKFKRFILKGLIMLEYLVFWGYKSKVIDSTHDEWGKLDAERQAKNARAYQEWYAERHGLAREKAIEAGGAKIEMALIPPGWFWMGSPEDEEGHWNNEGPRHRVLISKPFYMGKYQVTQRQWQAVMGDNPAYFKESGLDAPVEQVSWDDFQEFCGKTGTQLPSEAQWEYACRAGTTSPFNLGATIAPERVNYDDGDKYRDRTVGVGSLDNVNGFGLYDMHGNVVEWCADWYGYEYYGSSPASDPIGPSTGATRVARGGSWYSNARYCRSAGRDRFRAVWDVYDLGGRVIQEI